MIYLQNLVIVHFIFNRFRTLSSIKHKNDLNNTGTDDISKDFATFDNSTKLWNISFFREKTVGSDISHDVSI